MSDWRTWWERLAMEYVKSFQEKPEETLGSIANSEVALQCMCYLYNCFVREDGIETIEQLTDDNKRKLFVEAKRLTTNHSGNHITKVCRAIYLLGLITN